MVERVQQSHTTTLFVASVGDTRFEPADGTAIFVFVCPHNEDVTDPKADAINGRLVGSNSANSRRQGGRSVTSRRSATRTQQLSGRKT